MLRIHLHDVPQDGLAPNLDHGLWTSGSFFAESGAQATGQNHCFHGEVLSNHESKGQAAAEHTNASERKWRPGRPAASNCDRALWIMASDPQA